MKESDILAMLNVIKRALGLNVKIYQETIEAHHRVLKYFDAATVNKAVEKVCEVWGKRSLPEPAILKEFCEEFRPKGASSVPPYDQAKQKREEAEFYALKEKYKDELKDLKLRILQNVPLTDKQQKAHDIVMPYMDDFFGKRDLKKELSAPKSTPYKWSFAGLYMWASEGSVKPMSGNKGNLKPRAGLIG